MGQGGLFDLTGKVALVTGASRGIGRGLVVALRDAGATLTIAARTAEALDALAAESRELGATVYPIVADLSDAAEAQRIVATTVERFGRLDVLVNVSGTNIRKPSLDVTEADWDYIHNVNLKAVFFTCQAAARVMIPQGGGKIVNIASLSSVIGLANVVPYGASKGGIASLTRGLSVEWAQHRINVNAIAPGYLHTAMTDRLFADPERRAWVESRIPWGRTGVPEDLAGAVVFLTAPASDYLTGVVLPVDGGWLAG
ncbi:MAG: glucose 1-dehydrogenase [Chloroflexi bacterium]|nr:glucose 1-dehydrogenase [Chloroflexota bacterium]